ncbi:MAG: AAA family ATPase [Gemmatimonadota bacterium]
MGLKIAVAGKGGAGKTTVSVLLAGVLERRGQSVLLVDLDSDPNLAVALGIPPGRAIPLVHRADLVAERTGSTGEPGGMFLLNPKVSDIAEKYALAVSDRLSLLSVGTIERAGEGCFCPQTAFVRALVKRLILKEDESVVLDLEAGLESFGRAAVEGLDLLLVVVEPGMRSVETARRIAEMAPGLGIESVRIVANKVRPDTRGALIGRLAEQGFPATLSVAFSEELARRDLRGESVRDWVDARFEEEARALFDEPGVTRPPCR